MSPQILKSQLNTELLGFPWACAGSPVQGKPVNYLVQSWLSILW